MLAGSQLCAAVEQTVEPAGIAYSEIFPALLPEAGTAVMKLLLEAVIVV